MLKKRIAAVVLVRDGIVVQSVRFERYLPIGGPQIALEYLSRWGVDEITLLDIRASEGTRGPDLGMVQRACGACFVPVAVGGGITSLEQMRDLLHSGADKVVLNQALLQMPELVSEGAAEFGDQCMVASIDVMRMGGELRVYDHLAGAPTELRAEDLAARAQDLGAGELFINSVDRDGTYEGYDVDLVERVCAVARVPVVACGGARNGFDMAELLRRTPVSAAAAANFFHFTEHSVSLTKAIAAERASIRLDGHADYTGAPVDHDMRLRKRDDAVLEDLLYVRDEVDVI